MRPETDLQTPWLRVELIDRLTHLADPTWLAATTPGGQGSDALEETLDFFDDTGIFEDPGERIGYLLLDQLEADAIATLGHALGQVLDTQGDRDWSGVADASREAVKVLRRRE